jgi:hypothetical protein
LEQRLVITPTIRFLTPKWLGLFPGGLSMRVLCRFAFVVGLAALLTSPALAQRQRGQRGQQGQGRAGGMGGIGALLENESVQKELKIDKDQADKIKEAVKTVQDKHKDELAKVRDLPQDEQRAKGQEISKTVSEETLKAAGEILKPEQVTRLKQIELQQQGSRAFTRPEVQSALSLKDDQKEKIKTITDDSAKEMRDLRGAGNGQGGGGNREKVTALRKETAEKVQAVLTDDQKKAWKNLTGEPFEVANAGRRGPPQ